MLLFSNLVDVSVKQLKDTVRKSQITIHVSKIVLKNSTQKQKGNWIKICADTTTRFAYKSHHT